MGVERPMSVAVSGGNIHLVGRTRRVRGRVLVCLLGSVVVVGCSEKPDVPPPAATPAVTAGATDAGAGSAVDRPSTAQPRPPWELEATTDAARVYMDLSASMQGYERGPQSPLQALARELKSSLVAGGISQMDAVGFGMSLDRAVDGASLLEALAWRADKRDTCLKLPISEELRSFESSRRRAPRVMMVVTDSVASASTAGACGSECSTTSDQTCLATAVRDYISAGFALFVFGVKVPFSGTFYPAEGGAAKVNPPVPRPIYIWIGSPSVRLGREVLADALSWARRQNLSTVALDIWPGVWTGHDVAPVTSSSALTPPRGTMDVCTKRNSVTVDALPAGSTPAVRLRSIGGGQQHVWAARLPLTERPAGNGGEVLPLFTTSSKATLDGGSLQWNLDAKVPVALACISWTGGTARLQLEWSTTPSTSWQSSLVEWSEEFGKGIAADPSRTEGLQDLWALTARLLSRATPTAVSPLLEITVK